MSSKNFNNKIKNILLYNNSHKNIKDSSRNSLNYDLILNKSIINTSQKIKRDNSTIQIKGISPYECFHSKNLSKIKLRNNSNKNNTYKNLSKMKIYDELNTINHINNMKDTNFNKMTLKTIEYMNHSKNKKRKILKRNNTFKRFSKGNIGILNKPPLTLDSELFKLDKNFLREISPINNFIIVNKKKNEYLKKKKRELMDIKDSFYFDINILKDKNKTIKTTDFNYTIWNNSKYKLDKDCDNHKRYINRRIPSSLFKF